MYAHRPFNSDFDLINGSVESKYRSDEHLTGYSFNSFLNSIVIVLNQSVYRSNTHLLESKITIETAMIVFQHYFKSLRCDIEMYCGNGSIDSIKLIMNKPDARFRMILDLCKVNEYNVE